MYLIFTTSEYEISSSLLESISIPRIGITLSPGVIINTLLFSLNVFNLGLAFKTSTVAVNFKIFYVRSFKNFLLAECELWHSSSIK